MIHFYLTILLFLGSMVTKSGSEQDAVVVPAGVSFGATHERKATQSNTQSNTQ